MVETRQRDIDEPNMSDNTLLLKVEDLINIALGPSQRNVVNYKMVQAVLHILARQLRMLETQVEIRIDEYTSTTQMDKKGKGSDSSDSSPSSRKTSASKKDKKRDSRKKEKGKQERTKKGERGVSKDKAKVEKVSGKTDKATSKKSKKEERAVSKERHDAACTCTGCLEQEKAERLAAKEKELADKKPIQEEKSSEKELETVTSKTEIEKVDSCTVSGTSIVITETQREKDKVLVVEKGPTTRTDSKTRLGSIEVVTVSQFEILESAVNELKAVVGPLPTPALPDNQKLRTDIAKGRVSLSDTMKAMQLVARIEAAEKAVGRMADLITELAARGAIPKALVNMVEEVKAGLEETAAAVKTAEASGAAQKSVAIDATAVHPSASDDQMDTTLQKSVPSRASTAAGSQSRASSASPGRSRQSASDAIVTNREMLDALLNLKDDLKKNMEVITNKAVAAADAATAAAKVASAKGDVAANLDCRITTLNSLVADYAEQLSGFDDGLASQMMSFQEQMAQMRADLRSGLTMLEQANNSAESAAVKELTERYQGLVSELDFMLHAHQGLTGFQKYLNDDLRKLLERVELLQEQKADRDEVQDGLRDKADLSHLAGLLSESMFAASCAELENRLELCYDKFDRQEKTWLGALQDLTQITENKADIIQLLATRDEVQALLREIHQRLRRLAEILGDPMAAVITRKLSHDATCGACGLPALMGQVDINAGAPHLLPALRPRPAGAPSAPEEPCLTDQMLTKSLDARVHACHRWVGGSHTVISDAVTKEKAVPIPVQLRPMKKFSEYGSDGRLYKMEDEVEPCAECNVVNTEDKPDEPLPELPEFLQGAGDCDLGWGIIPRPESSFFF